MLIAYVLSRFPPLKNELVSVKKTGVKMSLAHRLNVCLISKVSSTSERVYWFLEL